MAPETLPRAPRGRAGTSDSGSDSNAMILGELRGQLGQVMQGLTSLNGKVDGLSREVFMLGPLSADLGEMKAKVTAADERIRLLEDKQTKRDGRDGLLVLAVKSPALGWLAGAGAATWAILSGKVHP